MSAYFTFEAIGTTWNINITDDISDDDKSLLIDAIKTRIAEFDKNYSRFRSDSLVTKMSQVAGTYHLPEDAKPMMALYKELYDVTLGLMTPLIGQTLADTGYDANYSLQAKAVISKSPRWEDVMEYKHPMLTIKTPVLLDFGAMGKGYLIDIVADIIKKHGVKNYTIDAGGDIAYKNTAGKFLRVGLEDPADSQKAVGVAEIVNQSIAGSAGNRRVWGKYHHIINPKTAESPEHILGLWTTSKTAMLADALATVLFFVEPQMIPTKYDFEYAIIYADRSAVVSKKFPGKLF